MQTEFHTLETLAARYHVKPLTLRRWVAGGLFPQPVRFGKRWLWPVGMIAEFEAQKTQQSQVPRETVQ